MGSLNNGLPITQNSGVLIARHMGHSIELQDYTRDALNRAANEQYPLELPAPVVVDEGPLPSSLTNDFIIWLDSSDEDTLDAVGSTLNNITDKSPNATVYDGGDQTEPTLLVGGEYSYSGSDVTVMDFANRKLATTEAIVDGQSAITVYIVASNFNSFTPSIFGAGYAVNQYINFEYDGSSRFKLLLFDGSSLKVNQVPFADLTDGVDFYESRASGVLNVIKLTFVPGSSLDMKINDSEYTSVTASAGFSGSSTTYPVVMGRSSEWAGSGTGGTLDMGEIIVLNREVTAEEDTTIREYINGKWPTFYNQ